MKIDWNDPGFSESHLRGYYHSPWGFEETVARIAAASGQPVKSFDQYKSSVDFAGVFKGERFTLYDYKEGCEIHIGGSDALDLAGLIAELTPALSVVEPQPYEAEEYYEERRGHGWPKKN